MADHQVLAKIAVRKKIVFFNNALSPYSQRLFAALNSAGVDLAVMSCSARESNRDWNLDFTNGFPHKVLPGREIRIGVGRFAHVNWGIISELRRLRPRLLVINGFYPSMLIAAAWAWLTQTPLALHIDGWRETMPRTPFHHLVRPVVLKRCLCIITPGIKGREYFLAQGVLERRIHVVPLIPAWDAPSVEQAQPMRIYHALWCGRLNNETKNAGFFVKVCKELKRCVPKFLVRIIGTGSAEAEVLDLLRQSGINFVHSKAVDWRTMAEEFTAARLLFVPSVWEPWALVCNEAMQCGTPCFVSPHVGAADDLVIDNVNGRVLPLRVETWAVAATEILSDENEWKRLSIAAKTAASERNISFAVAEVLKAISAAVVQK